MNYRSDPDAVAIFKTTVEPDGLSVFETLWEARANLKARVESKIVLRRARLLNALKIRDKDLPAEPAPQPTPAVVEGVKAALDVVEGKGDTLVQTGPGFDAPTTGPALHDSSGEPAMPGFLRRGAAAE